MNNPFDELNKQMTDRQQIMTKKDYFAAMVLQTLLNDDDIKTKNIEALCETAIQIGSCLEHKLKEARN